MKNKVRLVVVLLFSIFSRASADDRIITPCSESIIEMTVDCDVWDFYDRPYRVSGEYYSYGDPIRFSRHLGHHIGRMTTEHCVKQNVHSPEFYFGHYRSNHNPPDDHRAIFDYILRVSNFGVGVGQHDGKHLYSRIRYSGRVNQITYRLYIFDDVAEIEGKAYYDKYYLLVLNKRPNTPNDVMDDLCESLLEGIHYKK